MNTTHQITDLLHAWNSGDYLAANKLMPLVDHELKKTARSYMSRERPDHILQPSDLINEAFAKLMAESQQVNWRSRRHFYAIVAWRMRQVLYRYGENRPTAHHTDLNSRIPEKESEDVKNLHRALNELASVRDRAAKVVELRYFGGYTIEESAYILDVSEATVEREWRFAKAWLFQRLAR